MITIPKGETLWVMYLNADNKRTYAITSDKYRNTYKLYKVENDNLIYTKRKSADPRDLERWVDYGNN